MAMDISIAGWQQSLRRTGT